ncbi:Uncharacterised protein [uncultured archaeon]|nr:Uncharacterised protein [uncultured archaeon]
MQKKRVISECKTLQVLFVFVLIFSANFARAELDFSINSKLDSSNGFDTDFYLQTDPAASNGFDTLDFEQQSFPSGNYSFLTSTVSGRNLILDAFPSSNRTVFLVYRVSPPSLGNLALSWASSALGYHYDSLLNDYGNDSGYTNLVSSKDMNSFSSYSVATSGAARYFSLRVTYVNFSCGDGTCNGARRGEDCSSCSADCGCSLGLTCSGGSCINASGGTNTGGGGGGGDTTTPKCIDSSWSTQSIGSCSYGQKPISQISNCGNTRTTYEACCDAGTVYGDWSACSRSNTRTRNVQQTSENCQVTDSIETGSCTYQCSESWSCDWGSCQNGFISPTNCVERNNCGTQDNKPTPITCTQEGNVTQVLVSGISAGEQSILPAVQNCSINFICGEWSSCNVKNGMEDIKNAQGNLDGAKSRKCDDANSCINAPYYEQQKCSLKLFITPKQETVCGQQYLDIYEQGTDYLLARIKDDRPAKGTFSVQFILGGKSRDNSCNPPVSDGYNYTTLEAIMSYTNLRKLWGILQ